MPDSTIAFRQFLAELMVYQRTLGVLGCTANANSYIPDQVYIYQAQAEASGHYDRAANIKAAQTAVLAGVLALTGMCLGGLLMARIAAAAAGEAGVASAAAVPGILEIRGVTLISTVGHTAPGLTFAETAAVEGVFGTWVRAGFAGLGAVITDAYKGQANWSDWAKILVTSLGGIHRFGPAPAFLMSYVEGKDDAALRAAFEKEIAAPDIKSVMESIDKNFSARLMSAIKNAGPFAPLILAPRGELDRKIRQPMQVAVDKVTDQIVAQETGVFGGPERGDVYAKVYARFGANIIAPVARDIGAVRVMLEMQLQQSEKLLDKAFRAWAASIVK